MIATAPHIANNLESVAAVEKQRLVQNYGRHPLLLDRGKGVHVYDADRKRYLDFITGIGVNALGHGHPRLMKAMREQMGKLIHCSNLYYHRFQGQLAARLAEMSGLNRAFFANSGTEAVEAALKMAKGYGRARSETKHEIVALEGAFAGRTLGAIAVTGQPQYREPFEPLMPGVKFVPVNDEAALEGAVGANTAGVIIEPILGEGGIIEITRGFAARAAELARQHDALLILDEIQCGLGRAGGYFAFQDWRQAGPDGAGLRIEPDVVTIAKPLGGGLPLGAALANEKAAAMLGAGMHGSTFGGGALACRVALEFLDAMDEQLPMIREIGLYFRRRLEELELKYDFVKGVRGRGLMLGLVLGFPGKEIVEKAQERGLLINCTAGDVLRFLPPYIVERRHVDQAVAALDAIFEERLGAARESSSPQRLRPGSSPGYRESREADKKTS